MLRSQLLFLSVCVGALALVLLYGDTEVGFTLIYALAMLLGLSLLSVATAPLFVKIDEWDEGGELFKDEALKYGVTIVNRGLFFYPRVKITWFSADVLRYGEREFSFTSLGPRGRVKQEYQLVFPYRGVYRVGIKSMVVTDFLGLFRFTFTAKNPLTVRVYPRIDEDFALILRSDSQSAARGDDRFNEDYTTVADVRKYEPADSLKRVHWKLSAKRGELMVKNFQPYVPGRTMLFLDTKRPPLGGSEKAAFEDKVVSYVAAAADLCMLKRLPADLLYGRAFSGRFLIDPAGEPENLYGLLAAIPFDHAQSSFLAYDFAHDQNAESLNLLLFLTGIDEEAYDAIRGYLFYDYRIVLYYFYADEIPVSEDSEFYLDSLDALGIAVHRIPARPTEEPEIPL